MLRWAEQEREPVTAKNLGVARRSHALLAQFVEDPEVLSYHFWGFLNVCLVEDAWQTSKVEIENGVEVWRTVVLATTQKSQAEVLRHEDAVLQPDHVTGAKDIEKALVSWDTICLEYLEAGGHAVSDCRKFSILMGMLPASLKTL